MVVFMLISKKNKRKNPAIFNKEVKT